MPNLENPSGQNPLALAGREKARLDVYAEQRELKGSSLPHEMSYSTKRTLQYGVTPAQESCRAVHMFRFRCAAADLAVAP
jgi:hypothetical protein